MPVRGSSHRTRITRGWSTLPADQQPRYGQQEPHGGIYPPIAGEPPHEGGRAHITPRSPPLCHGGDTAQNLPFSDPASLIAPWDVKPAGKTSV